MLDEVTFPKQCEWSRAMTNNQLIEDLNQLIEDLNQLIENLNQ